MSMTVFVTGCEDQGPAALHKCSYENKEEKKNKNTALIMMDKRACSPLHFLLPFLLYGCALYAMFYVNMQLGRC